MTRKSVCALVEVTSEQVDKCEAFVVVSVADPEWVAVIPRAYFTSLPQDLERGEYHQMRYGGSTHASVAQWSPLPANMAPFVMNAQRHLHIALQNIADSARSRSTNPL